MVLSPITHQPAKLLERIPASLIEKQYSDEIQMDVSAYFKNLIEIDLYECQQTGYRFFYPLNIAGDAAFYEDLQKYDWYYRDWKWDYDNALGFIDDNAKVLDIGCGYGNFLKYIKKEKNCDCAGLEFNDKAMQIGRQNGLTMYKESIEEHAETHAEQYDIVCYFQVLEHIAEIDSFISASIKTLKKGGKLIICVPNNNPYWFHHFKYHSLNLPPHHMGWWDKKSFESLVNIYPLKLKAIIEERLVRYRFYTQLSIEKMVGENKLLKALYTLFTPLIVAKNLINGKNIKVGNILAVYTKQ